MDIVAIVVLAFLFVTLFWVALLEILARASGWKRTAQRYATNTRPADGQKFRMQNCTFGWVDYNGCVTIIVFAGGVYLALWPLFKLSHRPLLIPWSELHVLKVKAKGIFKQVKLAIEEPPIATVKLPYKVVEAAQQLAPAWSVGDFDAP